MSTEPHLLLIYFFFRIITLSSNRIEVRINEIIYPIIAHQVELNDIEEISTIQLVWSVITEAARTRS